MKTEQLYQIYLKHPLICTDTRNISELCLFFALKGDNFNANQFALQALEEGASFAVIDDARYAVNERCILVDDVLTALQELAKFHRRQLRVPVIGITGTNGKTTTKELIHSVLSQHFNCYATRGNLNNHIGVPLTLLSINSGHEIAIIEMGANHKKEIGFLCSVAQPTHGLITNVGKAHLEGFGGIEGVRIAKGELYEYLAQTGGTGFINSDNELLMELARERNLQKLVTYGRSDADLIVQLKEVYPSLTLEWETKTGDQSLSYHAVSNLPGTYNFENIAAAICIGNFFKLSPEDINSGILAYIPENSRSQIIETENNTIISDYYNANPSSMSVALDNLGSIGKPNKVMILGDMFELGDEAGTEHELVIQKALKTDADQRIFIGEEFYKLKNNTEAEFYRNTDEAFEAIERKPIKNSTILVKGSRGMKLEKLLPLL